MTTTMTIRAKNGKPYEVTVTSTRAYDKEAEKAFLRYCGKLAREIERNEVKGKQE